MKPNITKPFQITLCALIALIFGTIMLIYVRPMADVSLDLSLMIDDGEGPEDFDDHGWTVFSQNGDTVTELTGDGLGSYTGIEPGDTLYFSRFMTEELDSPTMQLGAVNRNFAVFLDGELVYTDCPELTNRIGQLQLPMKEWDELEPLTISLPADYQYKTLTIAQSTPTYSETSVYRVYPASVRLYCGYSYESALIAESFSTAFLSAAFFLAGVLLLIAYVRSRKVAAIAIAMVSFLWMVTFLFEVSFLEHYFAFEKYDTVGICRHLSGLALMIYLTAQAGRHKACIRIINILYALSLALYLAATYLLPAYSIHPVVSFLKGSLQEWLLTAAMAAVLVLGLIFWRKEQRFYRFFAAPAIAILAVFWIIRILRDPGQVWQQLCLCLQSGQISYFCRAMFPLFTVLVLAAALVEALMYELEQRSEKQLVEQHREMELASYENLYRQHEEVMMLRHDMTRHFQALRELDDSRQIHDYLDHLIGQNKKVRSVIQSGNEMMDIILNSKLSAAADMGIRVEILKAEAPANLPLSDADLCSVVMNILDNALAGAAASGSDEPWLCLDFHDSGNFFVFSCENSARMEQTTPKIQKTVPKHGLGLKIVHSIAESCEGLVDTEQSEDRYRIRVALPML